MTEINNDTEKSQFLIDPYKSILDDISLLHVANKFSDHHPDQKNISGSFTAKDL